MYRDVLGMGGVEDLPSNLDDAKPYIDCAAQRVKMIVTEAS
jgi:hypothetical protein